MSAQVRPPTPRRPPSTAGALLAALLVLLIAIGVWLGVGSLLREQDEVRPTSVDYIAAVEGAQAKGLTVYYPQSLPEGWIVTSVDVPTSASQPWMLGMLTDSGKFVGLRQASGDPIRVTQDQLGAETTPGPAVQLAANEIDQWFVVEGTPDVEGDSGLVSELSGGQSLLLYGSADQDTLGGLAREIVSTPYVSP